MMRGSSRSCMKRMHGQWILRILITKALSKASGIIDRVVLFFREVKVEIKKISWPQRNETIASTSIVIIIVLIIGIFLGIVDVGLARLVKLILS